MNIKESNAAPVRSRMPTVTPSDAPHDEIRALVQRVAELERTQRSEDVEGFLALFDADAVWVTGSGRRLIGRDAIAAFTRQVLPGAMSDGSVNYEVEHVAFIRSDVALTGVRQQYTDLQGQPKPGPSAGNPSYVWRRTGQTWKIVAGQNTGVLAEDR
jgi:uncharacterized protein (TIGR02246 family)